ncbi:2-amino-4-hydroxy-6-hydroxymethyldihydropteridinediphosphokinase [Psychrobacter arenosus]|uniref:2-amino-4-hydroxy-6- hydroxymethyldihydropteridine diphosphokinase n=1 Tax=Psychrobacter arenosus TaxID=256326 RepID=UPI00191B16E1|nr:2-amino-4-hydroxy-6-hydroxymethyldihydropteridine diphosphokinase [Psychrobacter arenosus]
MSENNSYGLDYASSLAEVIALIDDTGINLLNTPPFVITETAINQEAQVDSVLLAIGSNEQADYHLAQAREQLAKLGKMIVSAPLVNPDFTATPDAPKPDYTNQCVYIELNKGLSFLELNDYFAAIETLCERQRVLESGSLAEKTLPRNRAANTATTLANPPVKLVSMDIDILGFRPLADEEWRLIQRRLPLKDHEKMGLQELLTSPSLLPTTLSSLASAPLDSLKS